MDKKIKQLIRSSKQVFRQCSLENGAIIASPSTDKNTKDYHYVWPRDAAFTCIAANILNINIQPRFFDWCLKAEGWKKTGLFYKKYDLDGKKVRLEFQPDQNGTLLLALYDYYKGKKIPERHKRLVIKSAGGLCKAWKKNNFGIITQDVWEERFCFPDLKENFSYSLAACYKGLWCANELVRNKNWIKTANQMKNALLKGKDHFYRSFGKLDDKRADASLLGLAWPFGVVGLDDKRMVGTVKLMEKNIVKNRGVHRYEHDEYDGWLYQDVQRKKGSGYWPLLNFWMAICYKKNNNYVKAFSYYNKVLQDLTSTKIPEQIFDNHYQKSVMPLAWSHAMFIIASKELGYL